VLAAPVAVVDHLGQERAVSRWDGGRRRPSDTSSDDVSSQIVTEQALYILASLARGECHGYGIARDAEELSDGRVRLSAGTLYGALSRLADDGLVEAAGEAQVQGRRRRYYRITGRGQTALADEVERLRATAAALGARVRAAPA
jgi:PadR family transcriptional regulator, regulatory protein PadR